MLYAARLTEAVILIFTTLMHIAAIVLKFSLKLYHQMQCDVGTGIAKHACRSLVRAENSRWILLQPLKPSLRKHYEVVSICYVKSLSTLDRYDAHSVAFMRHLYRVRRGYPQCPNDAKVE